MFRRILISTLALVFVVAAVPTVASANNKNTTQKAANKATKKAVKDQGKIIKKNRPEIKKSISSIKKNKKAEGAATKKLVKKKASRDKVKAKGEKAQGKVNALKAKYQAIKAKLTAKKKDGSLKTKPGSRTEKKRNKKLVSLSKEIGGAEEKVRQLDIKQNRKAAKVVAADDALKKVQREGDKLKSQKDKQLKQNADARTEIARLRAENKAAKKAGAQPVAIADPNPGGAQLLRSSDQPVRYHQYDAAPTLPNNPNSQYGPPPVVQAANAQGAGNQYTAGPAAPWAQAGANPVPLQGGQYEVVPQQPGQYDQANDRLFAD